MRSLRHRQSQILQWSDPTADAALGIPRDDELAEVVAMAEYLIRRQRERSERSMASNWTKHLMTRHGATERELSELARDAIRLTEFHDFHHVEFAAQLDHAHDEYGQIHERKVLS